MAKDMSAAQIRKKRAQLLRRLARAGEIMKGSLVERWTRCGRPGCRCGKGDKHGPYLYVSVFRNGRTRSVYVPQHLQEEVRRWVQNARDLEEDLAEITWLNAQLLRHQSQEDRSKDGPNCAR